MFKDLFYRQNEILILILWMLLEIKMEKKLEMFSAGLWLVHYSDLV